MTADEPDTIQRQNRTDRPDQEAVHQWRNTTAPQNCCWNQVRLRSDFSLDKRTKQAVSPPGSSDAICPRPPLILTFDRLTLKPVCESHIRRGTFLPNLGTDLWVLELLADRQTDIQKDRQTDVQTDVQTDRRTDKSNAYCPLPHGQGIISNCNWQPKYLRWPRDEVVKLLDPRRPEWCFHQASKLEMGRYIENIVDISPIST